MTAPRPDAAAAQRGRTSRQLNWAALVLSVVALGFVVMARMSGTVRWPMVALPLLSIAQVGHAMGWTRRWPTVHRLFPAVMLVLSLVTVIGIVRVLATR